VRLRGRVGARARSICGRLCSRAGLCIRFPVMIFSLCIHNYHHRFFSRVPTLEDRGPRHIARALYIEFSQSHVCREKKKKNIGDDLCVLCMCDRNRRRDGDSTTHTHGLFYFFLFLWPVYEGAHMVPLASDQAQKILMCIRRLVFSSLGLCVCVCVHILLSPHHFLSLGCAPASYRRPPPSIHRQ
jgi:hypothetical protein